MTAERTPDTLAFTPKARKDKKSQQAGTPKEFLAAVERQFSVKLGFDLACTQKDCVAVVDHGRIKCDADGTPNPEGKEWIGGQSKHGYFYDLGVNALEQDWNTIEQPVAWLNNEFNHIAPWAAKCYLTQRDKFKQKPSGEQIGPRIFNLQPAGVSTKWFRDFVAGHADVYFTYPRIPFINATTGEPFKRWNEKKQRMETIGINRDCMLLDWNGQHLRQTHVFWWNWQTGELRVVA